MTPGRDLVAQVRESGVLDGASAVVVLLSGGRDSVALLDVCATLLGPERVRALHVDYGLRAAAQEDVAACAALCRRLDVELIVHPAGSADPPGAPSTGNLQAWARDVRYAEGARLAAMVPGCLLAPEKSTIDLRAAVTVPTGGAVYLPPGSSIPRTGARIVLGATRWTVTGAPHVWQLGIEVPVKRIT